MKEIKKGIVFSYAIERILSGVNAFDYKYQCVPSSGFIKNLREEFKMDVDKIFNNDVTIISEEEMLSVNEYIGGEYPHCYFR